MDRPEAVEGVALAGVVEDDLDPLADRHRRRVALDDVGHDPRPLVQLEDLGFCEKGKGGAFVSDGALESPHGALPFNTDGGGLCNNHPDNRGGITKVIEAVRQLRGETHPAVQVADCELALAHGTGGNLGTRMGSSTLILGREDT